MKDVILETMRQAADQTGAELEEVISDDTVLLESGLDSLGFAVLVALLEEELGYDPFAMMEDPVYPRTLAEFVGVYQRFAPR